MQIIDPKLKFTGPFAIRKKTERIIFHHSATKGDVDAKTVHQWHLNNGWKGIGYQYLIRTSGLIEIGRPEWVIGSHSGAAGNSNGIGICVAGNFMTNKLTDQQYQACVDIAKDIFSRYGVLLIQGHRDVMATACPGTNFPLDQIRSAVVTKAVYPPVNISAAGHKITGFLHNGKTMAPARQVLDACKIPFSWNAATNSVVIGFYKLPAMIVDGVGYVQIRELAAAFDRGVSWDAASKTAVIN